MRPIHMPVSVEEVCPSNPEIRNKRQQEKGREKVARKWFYVRASGIAFSRQGWRHLEA
jgi:hypothetical protein